MRSLFFAIAALSISCRNPATATSSDTPPARAAQEPAAPRGPTARIQTQRGPVTVNLEVARTPAVRTRGLMFRRELAEDAGMLFVFPAPEHQTFWMHNTLIPLDMIFIRADRTILGIVKNATPETDDPREVPGESMYVLEVNGGWCDRHGVAAGQRVELTGVAPVME